MKKIQIKQIAMKAVGVGGGAFIAAKANTMLSTQLADGKVRGGVLLAAGLIVPALLGKGKQAALIQDVGAGVASVGAMVLVNGFLDASKKLSIAGLDTLQGLPYAQTAYATPSLGNMSTLSGNANYSWD